MPLDNATHREHVRAVTMRHMDVEQIVVHDDDGQVIPINHFYKTMGKTLVIELRNK